MTFLRFFFLWQFKSIWINMSVITEIVIVFTAMFVDGVWSSWTNYSSCSVSMGHGVRHRTRNCNNPKPCGLLAEPCQGTNYTEIECEGFSHFTLKFRYHYLICINAFLSHNAALLRNNYCSLFDAFQNSHPASKVRCLAGTTTQQTTRWFYIPRPT